MKIGIIGIPNSGKTTIFNALTGLNIETPHYSNQKCEPNIGVVNVYDERVKKLSEIYQPQKTIFANIEYLDFAGFVSEKDTKESIPANLLNLAKTTDALMIVLKNFDDDFANKESLSAADQLALIENEMCFSDLLIASGRKEKLELNKKRGINDMAVILEMKTIDKVIEFLEQNKPIRSIELSDQEERMLRGFQFISQKPLLLILNSSETNYQKNNDIITDLTRKYEIVEFAGNIEMELNNLNEKEAAEFRKELGFIASARDLVTRLSYKILGYISFFTVGKDEVRAWTLIQGQSAVEAAGKIHSDLARGFIRAECFNYDDIMKFGNEKILREKGLFRLEGKNYIVKDGDILSIRFNV